MDRQKGPQKLDKHKEKWQHRGLYITPPLPSWLFIHRTTILHHSNGHDLASPLQIGFDALLVRAAKAMLESNAAQHRL